MTDPTNKNGDPLASAMKRAQAAVAGSGSDLELDLDDSPDAASPPSADNMDFGAIDLGGSSAELDLAEPKPKKPKIKTPDLLKDEEWGEDDKWADGDGTAEAPPRQEARKAGPPPQKVRRASPSADAPPPKPQAEPEPTDAEQVRRAASIRVSRHESAQRSYAGAIKVVLIILAVLLLGAGGYFGYTKWQESHQAELDAQMNALNQGSLDSLKDQAASREKLGS